MEKTLKKDVYVCVTESLCCTTEINTVHQLYFIKIKLKKKKKRTMNDCVWHYRVFMLTSMPLGPT